MSALAAAFAAGRVTAPEPDGPAFLSSGALPATTPAVHEAAALLRQVEVLEAELHHGATLVAHQEVLAQRHQRVSAVACANAAEHLADAQRLAQQQAERKRRLASASPGGLHGRKMAATEGTAAPVRKKGGREKSDGAPD